MELHVTSQEAASTLDELLDRVGAGESVVIEREGKVVARLIRPEPKGGTGRDLVELLRFMPRANDGWAEGVEQAIRLGNQPVELPEWDR